MGPDANTSVLVPTLHCSPEHTLSHYAIRNMGCDIHLAVEVRRNGKWEREVIVPEPLRDPWYVEQAAKHPDSYYAKLAERQWFGDRNYRLFGVLANVRNGYGFAGISTGDPVVPISEPRGLPDDMSDDLRRIADDYVEDDIDLGDHSQSWLTLAELQAYPWAEGAVTAGVVTLEAFAKRLAQHGDSLPLSVDAAPYDAWCGATSGPGIVTLDAHDVIAAIRNKGLARPEGERTHVRDSWRTPIRSQCEDFVQRFIPALATLGTPEDVRIVFGFDN